MKVIISNLLLGARTPANEHESARFAIFRKMAFILVFCVGSLALDKPLSAASMPVVTKGDLSALDWSYAQGPALEVNGEWEVIWDKIVSPDEFDQHYKGEYFTLPGRWNQVERPSGTGPMGAATFRVRLELPEYSSDVAFHMIAAHSAYRIYIDGVPIIANGEVSEIPEGFEANYVSRSFPGKSGKSEIVMQVSNFVHAHAGPGHALTLWDAGRLQRYLDILSVVYGLLTGVLFALGLFQLTIFFSDRKDKTNGPIHLWFSLLCFIIVYRVHGAIPLLHEYFPDSGYWDNLRLSYASLYASPAVFLLFFRATFPDEFPKILTSWIIRISILFLAYTLVVPEYYYTSTRNFAIPLNVATVIYCLIFTIKATLASQPGARAILISNFVFLLTAIHDGVIYTDQSTGFDMTPFGILILGLGYSYALMLRLQKTFYEAHQTSAALKTLNLELEKKVEERTLDYKKAAAKAENEADERARFISAASHDLRQPIHALSIFNETLKRASTPDGELAQIASKQNTIISSLTEMLETMLDASRLEAKTLSVNMTEVSLEDMFSSLQAAMHPIAVQQDVELRFVASSKCILADEKHLRRVMSNLITNAIKASAEKNNAGGKVLVGCKVAGDNLQLVVADNGCGIRAEDQERIFYRYAQTVSKNGVAQSGLGLGLAIVDELCSLMGMKIDLRSMLNRGTVFRLSAKVIKANTKQVSKPQNVINPNVVYSSERLIVLIVDDSKPARDALTDLFRSWGHAARGVETIDQAITTLEDLGRPGLLVVDYRLDENTTGLDVITAVQKRFEDVPAVIITGATSPADLQTLAASSYTVFHKPIDPKALEKHIVDMFSFETHDDKTMDKAI